MPDNFTDKRVKYDAAFRAEALRLANQSRSFAAAARALNIRVKLLYKWRDAAQMPVAVFESSIDSAAELRQLRATSLRQAQELEILKKAIGIVSNQSAL
ncbi:transposase [Hymenobacter actinosclerus]|uniref:Transposase n=1 Tax=Hymenobacter actinosclerus TaxID=82805 RepID=A0A1I0JBP6_9BACT|nr:transposase [Hymenobacter actinosclerus]SEU06593.1 transposase [Hymenobacter actinosclerus]